MCPVAKIPSERLFRHLPHSTSLTTDACFEANLTVSSRANGAYVGTVVEHAAIDTGSDCCAGNNYSMLDI